MPVAAELLSHLVDGATTASDILGGSQRRTSRELHPRMGDAIVLLGPASIRTISVFAAPSALVPVQRRRLAAELQINENDLSPALQLGRNPTDPTSGSLGDRLDVQVDVIICRVHADDIDFRQTDQALEHLSRVGLKVVGKLALGRHRVTLAASR